MRQQRLWVLQQLLWMHQQQNNYAALQQQSVWQRLWGASAAAVDASAAAVDAPATIGVAAATGDASAAVVGASAAARMSRPFALDLRSALPLPLWLPLPLLLPKLPIAAGESAETAVAS